MENLKSLTRLEIYNLTEELADRIWEIIQIWGFFPRLSIGTQLVNAADSISANIDKGLGRYHYKNNVNFPCYR